MMDFFVVHHLISQATSSAGDLSWPYKGPLPTGISRRPNLFSYIACSVAIKIAFFLLL